MKLHVAMDQLLGYKGNEIKSAFIAHCSSELYRKENLAMFFIEIKQTFKLISSEL